MRRAWASLLLVAAAGCSESTVGETCDPRAAGPIAFSDATEQWGLGKSGLAVTGNRISTADLDGDGYPDLVIRPIRVNLRETVGVAPKLVWVLMNRPAPGGGRTFVDATVDSGLYAVRGGDGTTLHSTHVVVMGDVDNDGDLDAFGGTYVDSNHPETDPGDRSQLLLNDGSGHFSIAPDTALGAWNGELRATTGASFTDVDRDGKLDLFVGFFYQFYGKTLNGYQAELYRGLGDGGFAIATADAGLVTDGDIASFQNPRPSYGVTACDLDDDGAPELMVGAYGRQLNLQYLNDGRGHFTEVGQTSGYAADDDLDYADDWTFVCSCLDGSVTDAKCPAATSEAMQICSSLDGLRGGWQPGFSDQPYRLGGVNFSTVCADLDGDGRLDLYNTTDRHWDVGSAADPSQLLSNRTSPGVLSFLRVPNSDSGIMKAQPKYDWNEGWLHAAAMDFDNDGLLDLLVGATDYPDNVGLLFRHGAGHTFTEVGAQAGMQHACLSGLAVADFDRDGDLDVVVGSGTARDCSKIWPTNEVHLYESHAADGGASGWIELRLRGNGTSTNAAAIGAKVTVRAGAETMVREVSAGYGHMAIQNDPIVHVGLGACDGARSIEVRWPDATSTTETWSHVRGRQLVELTQGAGEAKTILSAAAR